MCNNMQSSLKKKKLQQLMCPFLFYSLLQYLFDNIWLDVYTRAVFVEFTVYNANVNLFCIVTLIFETTGVGEASPLYIL